MTTMPLSGIRILDLGRLIAAPSCTQILADLGAEVIKVERPVTGDEIRTYGPPFLTNREGGEDDSPYHLAVNRNKKSITIDIATREGQDLILELAKVSDVFMENFKVGDLKRYGLDYDSIREMNPGIVYCSLTGFGQTGPSAHRPGLDSLFQAMSGLMSVTGEADGAPQKVGIAVSDFIAGLYASIGILGALRHREVNKGEGQHIDIALLDSTIAAFTNRAQGYLTSGINPVRNGSVTPGNQPAGLYGCSDGDIILSAGADRQFKAMVGLIGRQDLAEDARFQSRPLWAVVEGQVRLRAYPVSGAEVLIRILGAGSWFGELSTLDGGPRPQDAAAFGPAIVLNIPSGVFSRLAEREPAYYRDLGLLACAHQRAALAFIGQRVSQPMVVRLAKALLGASRDVGSEDLALRQAELAVLVGVSRQTLNRELKKFERDGILSAGYGRVVIRDLTRLRAVGRRNEG